MLSEVIVYFYYWPAIKILGSKYAYPILNIFHSVHSHIFKHLSDYIDQMHISDFEYIPFCAFSYFQTPLRLDRPNAHIWFWIYSILCILIFSNTSPIRSTKCTKFIHCIHLLCFCYMFQCYLHHNQWELCPLIVQLHAVMRSVTVDNSCRTEVGFKQRIRSSHWRWRK